MSGEVSYFSRFFAKFVEIIAAGLASAICAYLLAHFGGVLLTSATPAPAPVTPTASLLADSVRAQPIPLLAVAPVNERRAVPQKDIDAPAVQPAANAGKEAKTLPLRKHAKTATGVAEKGPRGQKSVEVLTRAALANIDADRPAPVDAPIGPGLNDTRARVDAIQPRQASVPPRQPDIGPRRIDVTPRGDGIKAAQPTADSEPQPVQFRPAPDANLQPRSQDLRTTIDPQLSNAAPQPSPVRPAPDANLQPRSQDLRTTIDSQLSNAAPQPSPVDQEKDVFSALRRIPDLLRPEPPMPIGEAPRPPMPVVTASPEREFGN